MGLPSITSISSSLLVRKKALSPSQVPPLIPTSTPSEGDGFPPETLQMPDNPPFLHPSEPSFIQTKHPLLLWGTPQGHWFSAPYYKGLQGSWSQTTGVNTALQAWTTPSSAIKQLFSHLVSLPPAFPHILTLVSWSQSELWRALIWLRYSHP